MSQIAQLFTKREKQYKISTNRIFGQMTHVLDAVTEFFSSIQHHHPEYMDGQVVWKDIILVDNFLMLIGTWKYDVGAKIQLEDELITITEDLVEYFQRVIRVGLPLDLVEQKDKDVVISFLKTEYENNDNELEPLYDDFSDDAIEDGLGGPLDPDTFDDDFDVDALTSEQRQSFKMFGTNKGGKC